MSGSKWPGYCSDVVRPCGRSATPGNLYRSVVLAEMQWGDRSWGGLCSCNTQAGQCGCSRLSEVSLGVHPVAAISQVRVDGLILDEALYRVDDYQYLVRLPDPDGSNPGWPCCQRLDLDADEEGTFEVAVTYGAVPPGNGKGAAAALACQFLKARDGDSDCNLPQGVQTLARQGVTMNIVGVTSLLQQGQTGVYEADLFLRAANPKGQQRPGGILIPGSKPSVRRVGT